MVAQHFNVSREKQDDYALRSHERATRAVESGIFASEILPLQIGDKLFDKDDTVRPGVNRESLATLKPAFADWGTASTTAGNASGLGDGAAILVITTRANAEKEGLEVVAKWGGATVVGVEPRYMGVGPAVAIPRLLEATGLSKQDVNVWEVGLSFTFTFEIVLLSSFLDQRGLCQPIRLLHRAT